MTGRLFRRSAWIARRRRWDATASSDHGCKFRKKRLLVLLPQCMVRCGSVSAWSGSGSLIGLVIKNRPWSGSDLSSRKYQIFQSFFSHENYNAPELCFCMSLLFMCIKQQYITRSNNMTFSGDFCRFLFEFFFGTRIWYTVFNPYTGFIPVKKMSCPTPTPSS